MKPTLSSMIALAALTALTATPAAARDLTIVAGGGPLQDHMRRVLFQPFGQSAGVPVADTSYDYNVGPIRTQVQARNVVWDVVMVEAPDLIKGCEDGVFEKIDWSVVKRDKFLPGGTTTCGAGAVGWGVSVFYDESKRPSGPANFVEFWDTARFPGKRALRKGARMSMEIALMADGVAKADVYKVLATPDGQRRAFAKLDQLRPNLTFWSGGQQPIELINAGEVAYAVGFVGRTANAIRAGSKFALRWDTLLYAYDYWAVVRGTPHAANAMKMVEYITSEAPLMALTDAWPINPVTASVAQSAAVRAKNPLMMSNHTGSGLNISTEFWLEHGTDLEQRFTAWANR